MVDVGGLKPFERLDDFPGHFKLDIVLREVEAVRARGIRGRYIGVDPPIEVERERESEQNSRDAVISFKLAGEIVWRVIRP